MCFIIFFFFSRPSSLFLREVTVTFWGQINTKRIHAREWLSNFEFDADGGFEVRECKIYVFFSILASQSGGNGYIFGVLGRFSLGCPHFLAKMAIFGGFRGRARPLFTLHSF